MTEIAPAKIYSLPSPAMLADSAPQDEPVFILTSSQLHEIVQDALKSQNSIFQAEISILREEVALERATDRRRIKELERGHTQPMQADRGEILRALLAANGGKMLAKEARGKMHLSKQSFSNLLATVQDVSSRPYHLDKRQIVLTLE